MDLFLEFTTIVLLATLLSIVMRVLKQPLVIAYILTGILISPQFFNLIHTKDYIELFSKMGITILLFIVGLNLSPKVIKEVGKVSIIGGLFQILLTAFYGWIAATLLGITLVPALYIGVALSFSSTIIVLKLLSDKGELQKLHGKVSIGILLVQDLVAILLLIVVSSFSDANSHASFSTVFFLLAAKTIGMFSALFLISKHIFPRAMRFLAESQEMLFLFSLTWGLGLACMFYIAGLSVEVGALVAGVSLSVTPFADSIASRLKPLRDFFIVLFFILLGSEMTLGTIHTILLPALILSLFVLVIKPLLVFLIMNLLGYKTRTSFETGVSLAQVSEFSLILATLGLSVGHITKETMSLLTLIALITIAASSYLILQSGWLYERLENFLKQLEIKKNTKEVLGGDKTPEVVLFGYDSVGRDFIQAFNKIDTDFIVIDINPDLISEMLTSNIPFKYGDAEDVEFLQELNLKSIKMCVSTIPTFKSNALLIQKIREVNPRAIVVVRCHEIDQAKALYDLGATYVVMPHYLGAKYASQMISRHGLNKKKFEEERAKHLEHVMRQ
jgi:Kef-type K+ transport system membrane component KefB